MTSKSNCVQTRQRALITKSSSCELEISDWLNSVVVRLTQYNHQKTGQCRTAWVSGCSNSSCWAMFQTMSSSRVYCIHILDIAEDLPDIGSAKLLRMSTAVLRHSKLAMQICRQVSITKTASPVALGCEASRPIERLACNNTVVKPRAKSPRGTMFADCGCDTIWKGLAGRPIDWRLRSIALAHCMQGTWRWKLKAK